METEMRFQEVRKVLNIMWQLFFFCAATQCQSGIGTNLMVHVLLFYEP